MMSEEDPFTLVQEEASRSLLDVQAQLAHWRELSSSSSEMDHTEANQVKVHLTATIGELQLDLDAMQSAVDNAAGDHAKFGIAPDELERRRAFISQTRAAANSIRDTLAAAKSVRSARKERLERQGLLAGRGSSSCEMASGAASSVEKIAEAGRLQRGVHQAHEDELQEQAQLQRAMVAEQDDDRASNPNPNLNPNPSPNPNPYPYPTPTPDSHAHHAPTPSPKQDDNLGMLSSTMTRLGQMGLAIKEELIAQGKALDELTDEVDSTSSKMKQAQQVMTKLLKSKDRGLFCCILALTITLGVLVYLVFFV